MRRSGCNASSPNSPILAPLIRSPKDLVWLAPSWLSVLPICLNPRRLRGWWALVMARCAAQTMACLPRFTRPRRTPMRRLRRSTARTLELLRCWVWRTSRPLTDSCVKLNHRYLREWTMRRHRGLKAFCMATRTRALPTWSPSGGGRVRHGLWWAGVPMPAYHQTP